MGSRNAAVFPEPTDTKPTLSISTCIQHHFIVLSQEVSRDMGYCVCPTCLCAGHEVSLRLHNRNGVFLDRRRSGVATQSNVTYDNLTHVHICELHSTHTIKHVLNDAADLSCNIVVKNSSLHCRCGEGSSVLWPQQECHRISQS